MVILRDIDEVDNRHTVDIINSISFAIAIQINEDGTYDRVNYMTDDVRTYGNEAIIDATEEELEIYRKQTKQFRIGDTVKIVNGRKMKNEIKEVAKMFRYTIPNTYGKQYTDYLVFTDGTKVNKLYCEIL